MKFFKQLFCNHIWKTINSEYLRTTGAILLSNWVIAREEHYANTKRCLKCDKEIMFEESYPLPDKRE